MFRSPRVLVAARILAGLKQSELAAEAGIALSVLQAIEQGKSDPKLSTLVALADALRAKGVELVAESDTVAWGVFTRRGSESGQPQRWGLDAAYALNARGQLPSVIEEEDAMAGKQAGGGPVLSALGEVINKDAIGGERPSKQTRDREKS